MRYMLFIPFLFFAGCAPSSDPSHDSYQLEELGPVGFFVQTAKAQSFIRPPSLLADGTTLQLQSVTFDGGAHILTAAGSQAPAATETHPYPEPIAHCVLSRVLTVDQAGDYQNAFAALKVCRRHQPSGILSLIAPTNWLSLTDDSTTVYESLLYQSGTGLCSSNEQAALIEKMFSDVDTTQPMTCIPQEYFPSTTAQ